MVAFYRQRAAYAAGGGAAATAAATVVAMATSWTATPVRSQTMVCFGSRASWGFRKRAPSSDLGSTRVIQVRFNVSVPRAARSKKASTLRNRSEG